MIFIAKGNAYFGQTEKDDSGNIVKKIPPRFEESEQGSCVAVGKMDSETNKQIGSADIFADWQAAEFLGKVLELIEPKRQTNIPNFGKIISRAYKDGFDVCQYCDGLQCQNCIVDEWKNETEDEQ